MGHLRLGRLPATRKWRQVVALLEQGASAAQVSEATATAADSALASALGLDPKGGEGFAEAAHIEGLVHAVWLLTQIPIAARESNFAEALRELEIDVPENPGTLDVICGFSGAVEAESQRAGQRSDMAEMAALAAAQSLTALVQSRSVGLFETTPEDVRQAFRSLSTPTGFKTLAQGFFARFVERYLAYHLSRELSNHVGPGRRFEDPQQCRDFEEALATHCRQTTQIVREFAGGWHSKANFEGGITRQKARAFTHVALKKIRSELRQRGG